MCLGLLLLLLLPWLGPGFLEVVAAFAWPATKLYRAQQRLLLLINSSHVVLSSLFNF